MFNSHVYYSRQDEKPEPDAEDGYLAESGSPKAADQEENQWADKVNYDSDPQNNESSVRAVPSANSSPVQEPPLVDNSGAAFDHEGAGV